MKPNLILPSQNMNIIRFALVLPLILLIAILPFGCRQDESKIRIGVSVPKTTAPIYTLMREKMIELGKAEKHNVEVIWGKTWRNNFSFVCLNLWKLGGARVRRADN